MSEIRLKAVYSCQTKLLANCRADFLGTGKVQKRDPADRHTNSNRNISLSFHRTRPSQIDPRAFFFVPRIDGKTCRVKDRKCNFEGTKGVRNRLLKLGAQESQGAAVDLSEFFLTNS